MGNGLSTLDGTSNAILLYRCGKSFRSKVLSAGAAALTVDRVLVARTHEALDPPDSGLHLRANRVCLTIWKCSVPWLNPKSVEWLYPSCVSQRVFKALDQGVH